MDTDNLILNFVKHHNFIRRNKLISEIKEILKESKGIDRKEISKITIDRSIKRLIRLDELRILKKEELERFGIYDSDKRASYLTLSKIANSVKFYDKVFNLLIKGNEKQKKNSLVEIESMMKNVVLTPKQLDKLLDILKNNMHLGEQIIRIIYNSVNKKIIFPSNIENLKKVFKKYYEEKLFNYSHQDKLNFLKGWVPNVKSKIIFILGLLNEKIILEWLKKDVLMDKNFDMLNSEGYTLWTTSRIIDNNKEKLFDFQNTLDEERSKILFQIRTQAEHLLSTYEMHYPKFKERLEELEDYDNKKK